MLVHQYHPKFVRPPNPSAQHLRCFAQLDGNLRQVLPYLNTVLKGHQFFPEPPSLTLKYGGGKLITLTPHEIAINIVKDEAEAVAILDWLLREINATWEHRGKLPRASRWLRRPESWKSLNFCHAATAAPAGRPPAWGSLCSWARGLSSPANVLPLTRKSEKGYKNISGNFIFRVNKSCLEGPS